MQEWTNITTAIASAAVAVLMAIPMLISTWRKIKDAVEASHKSRDQGDLAVLLRNWLAVLYVAIGLSAIVAAFVLPLSKTSVVMSAVGSLLASVGAASAFVQEATFRLADRVFDVLVAYSRIEARQTGLIEKIVEAQSSNKKAARGGE